MNKRAEIIRILNNILIVYTVSMVFFAAMQIPLGTALFVGNLSLILFVGLSEIISAYVGNLIIFLGLHFASAAVCLFLGNLISLHSTTELVFAGIPESAANTTLRALIMLIITVTAIYTRIDGKPRFFPEIAEGFLFIGLYVLCLIARQRQAIVIVLLAEILWAFLCILFYNVRQTIGALVPFKERDFVPYESIKRNNGSMLRITLSIASVFMLICVLLDYGREIVEFIRSVVVRFLRWLFSFYKPTPVEEVETPVTETTGGGFGEFLPVEEDNSLMHAIWQALFWIVAFVVAILIIFLFARLVKEFYKLFNSSRKAIKDRLSRDVVEYLNPLQESGNTGRDRSSSRLGFMRRMTSEGRVRYLFIKYIESGRGRDEIRNSDSPREMETKINEKNEAIAYQLYEKARYSSTDITSEDVSEMKRLVSMK